MKKIIIIGLFLASILISACGTTTDGGGSKNPFIGGTTGILIEFAEGAPPEKTYAGGDAPFDVFVILRNDGEYSINTEDAVVTIKGINAQEFGKTESDLTMSPPDDLTSRRKEDDIIIESPPVYVEFFDLNRLEDFSGSAYTIQADVCYKYGTEIVSKICIKSNNLDDKEGVCTINENKAVYGSSAPVQVTDFKENARSKDKVAFSFTVAHKGNGQIYKLDSDCGKENRRSNENRVWVEVKTGLSGLTCSGLRDGSDTEGTVALYGGDTMVTCTQVVDTGSDYEKPVEISLRYDYRDSTETEIMVSGSGEI